MRKLVSLTLAILAIAVLVFPSAATARGVEFPSGKYYQEPFNTPGKDLFSPGGVTGGGAYSLDNGWNGPTSGASYSAGQKLVCITFDDGWQNQYDNALPALQQHGFKATFAVVTDWIGTGTGAGQCMNSSELHTLADQGMDIASHTITHDDWETLNASDMQTEVVGSKTALEQAGFTVRTFVYPFYYYNDNIVTAVKNAGYICARSGARSNPYTPGSRTDPNAQYYIDAIDINTQNFNTFKSIVDQATDQSVICLNYHSVSDAGLPTPCTPTANFAQQMQYLKDNNFAVVLLPDLVQDPWISCSPVSLSFSSMLSGSNPAAQALSITNTGGNSTLTWTASSGAAWLTLSPTGGTAPGSVTVTTDISGLSAGAYNSTITITATGATNTPQTVPVTLIVQTPSSNWLAGWSYRKQIAIAGSSAGAQTNYPMKLTINRSTGTDSGATVYLGDKCAIDYKDIRFTAFDGMTFLDYWIESSTSSTATVWVELDSVPVSPGTANFNLYYGNSGATSASNIINTFTFADDFDGISLDAVRWPTVGGTGGTVTENSGVLTVTAGSSDQKYVASAIPYTNGYALHARAKLDSITGSGYRLIGFVTTPGNYPDNLFTTTYRLYDSETNFVAVSGDGSNSAQANMNVSADTDYHVSECRRYAVSGTNYDRFIIGAGAAVSGAYPTATARYIYINSDVLGKAIIVDWIFLRKFVSIEPTWAAWGNEETAGSPAKAITAFSFNALTPPVTGVVTESTHTVALSVPYGTAVTALVPTITHTGASVNPASGIAQNFTTPQTYTVTAADTSTQAYTVTVTVAPNTAKAITAFNFNALTPAVIGVVTESTHAVALSVPYGTAVTALVPTITHTGASVNPASGIAHNFTTPQTYTVTAADASTQAYTVTVTVAPNTSKAITAFNFNALTPPVTGVVTEATHTVALSVPYGTAVTALVPTITHTGASVNPASGASNNFTTPQTYTVTAADASTQAYTVTVTVAPNTSKAITAFNFNALTPPVAGVVTEATHTVALSVPYGTAVTALVPTIAHTGASVNPASGAAQNFTTPQTYTVTAADASTQAYTVTVTALSQPATIVVSPSSLTYSGVQGGTNPATQELSISNSGGGTLNWTASSSAGWLTLAPTNGTAPGTVTVTANTTGLNANTYNGTITITSAGATNTPQTVPVTLTVAPSDGTLQKLLGADDAASYATATTGYMWVERWPASSSGTLNTIRVKGTGNGAVKVAIFADSGGQPGTLLGYQNTSTTITAGWNTISLSQTANISAGTNYWLATASGTACMGYIYPAMAVGGYKAIDYNTFTFSSSPSGLASQTVWYIQAAGWGSSTPDTPPAAPVVTNGTGAGLVTEATARLNGEITSTGGQSPTVHVYWGDNDGGVAAGNWDHDVSLGTLGMGAFYTNISGLTSTTTYYYRCYASNSGGSDWADSTASFTTSTPTPPSAPVATNSTGASLVTEATARLNGEVTSTGGQSPAVHVYWGDNDGGTTAGGWDHDVSLGTLGIGAFYTNISGLTSTTTYYYRCYASNSGGSDWADSTASFTTPAVQPKLIGADDAASYATATTGYMYVERWVASSSGTVITIRVKGTGNGAVKVAIYADSGGQPGTLLGYQNTSTTIAAGWNTISLSQTANISAGTNYWLATASGTACMGYIYPATVVGGYKAIDYNTFTFSSNPSGLTSQTVWYIQAAGWGSSAPVTPPIAPILVAPGASITFQWGTSSGASKYWLQVNTSQLFTGTNIINADIGNITLREVTGFSLGTTYYWRVRAGNDSGWGPWSSTRSLTAH